VPFAIHPEAVEEPLPAEVMVLYLPSPNNRSTHQILHKHGTIGYLNEDRGFAAPFLRLPQELLHRFKQTFRSLSLIRIYN
jgi:hypothetical protein